MKLSSNPRTYLSKQVSLCLMNVRSIRNKTTDILDHVQEHDIDIVAMTKTWLSNKAADIPVIKTLTPPGYSLVHHPRSSRRGGGMGILHKDHIKATGKHIFNRIRSCEAMGVKLTYHVICQFSDDPSEIMDHLLLIFSVNSAISLTNTYHWPMSW